MSNLDQVWGATSAESGFAEDNEPPAGYVGVPRVSATRTGTTKKGELYFSIDLVDGDYRWSIFKQLTSNGQPVEGKIKSAKITLRQFGLDVQSPAQLGAMIKQLEGRYFAAEHVASDRINATTGMPYLNTNITGPASAPALDVTAQPAAPAPAVQGPTLDQVMTGQVPQAQAPTFPAAVPGQAPTVVQPQGQAPAAAMQQQVQQQVAAAQADDNPGW